jgi:hypothetical protein
MTKRIELHREEGTSARIQALRQSAAATHARLVKVVREDDPLQALARMKFEPIGYDPLDASKNLNLIEQLNQTFTYLATFKGAELIFRKHPMISILTLNLGNVSGWDIESQGDDGIVAEVFAAVNTTNNKKLSSDIKKLLSATQRHRYAFFMCPKGPEGQIQHKLAGDRVTVWSLGYGV